MDADDGQANVDDASNQESIGASETTSGLSSGAATGSSSGPPTGSSVGSSAGLSRGASSGSSANASSGTSVGSDAGLPANAHVAVIGAGLSGLVAAEQLIAAGCRVTVLEKSRGAGGRAATRYAGPWHFDHGMQYFTARSPAFRGQVAAWVDAGCCSAWTPRAVTIAAPGAVPVPLDPREPWYVGQPSNNAMCKHIVDAQSPESLVFVRGIRVGAVHPADGGGPSLEIESWPEDAEARAAAESAIAEGFDAIVVSVPAPQVPGLLAPCDGLADCADGVAIRPCWAAMYAFDAPLDVPWDAAAVDAGPVSWIARNSSRPGRAVAPGGETWVLHGSPAWSARHLELDRDDIDRILWSHFEGMTVGTTGALEAAHRSVHRWRYSLVTEPSGRSHRWNADLRVGVCGDWCLAGRFEAAFTSARSLANAMTMAASSTGGTA